MKLHIKLPCTTLATSLAAALQLAAIAAAVPLAWEARPGNPAPAQFTRYHGETLALRCTLAGFDGDLSAQGDVRLWFQTNGMGRLWWSAPATAASNRIEAAFGAAEDVGADRVSLFLGSPSNVYASAVLRLMPSPGFTPADLSLPVLRLDFDALAVTNAPYYTKDETDGVASDLLGDISRKADMYRYEGGAASNVLVSCQWLMAAGSRFLTLRELEGQNDSWFFSPGPRRLGGTSYVLTYRDTDGWVLALGQATAGPHPAYTNRQDRLSATLDFDSGAYVLTRTNEVWAAGTNRYPVVYRDELGVVVSNVVTKSYVEDLGIESGIQSEEDPVWSTDKPNYATKSEVGEMRGDIEEMRAENAIVYRLYQGSNVVAEVTNYNSAVHAPTLRLMQLNESNEYVTVWAETNGLTRTLNEAKEYADGATNELKNVYAPRAWSRTTSGLGADAPSNTTWISTEKLVIASGQEYVEIASSGVWVLCTNGQVDFSAKTDSFFTISDNSGNPVFSVERAGAAPIPVYCSEIRVHNSGDSKIVTVPVPVFDVTENKNDPPYLNVATDLQGTWYSETNGIPSSIVTSCTWSGQNGAWTNTVVVPATHQHVFFTYHKWQPGGTIIRNNATTDLSFGIYVNGVKFVPSVSGNNLIWTKQ
jgi:hypothetical protein